MPQHSPLLHLPWFPGTQTPSQTHPPLLALGLQRSPAAGPPVWFPGWVWGSPLSASVLGAAHRKCAACSKNKSPDSNMMYLLWFPCRYTRNECIYYVGVCWNVNFESHFSQSIIISSLSQSRNFLEREGLISVTVFKQFELGSFCKTIISFLLSQLNFAWG